MPASHDIPVDLLADRGNPNRGEDLMMMVLASCRMTEARGYIAQWHGSGVIDLEQRHVMWLLVGMREAPA